MLKIGFCFVALILQGTFAKSVGEAGEFVEVVPYPFLAQFSNSANEDRFSELLFSLLTPPVHPFSMFCLHGVGPSALAASRGDGLLTLSSSSCMPSGIALGSQLVYDGAVSIAGQMPFLGSIALEGSLPSCGSGAVIYGCSAGEIGIFSEDIEEPYDFESEANGDDVRTDDSVV